MAYRLHVFPALTLLVISLAVQFQLSRWILRSPKCSTTLRRKLVVFVSLFLAGLSCAGYLLGFNRVSRHVPPWWATWVEAVALFLCMAFIAWFLGAVVWRTGSKFRPGRRLFFRAAGGAIMAAPVVATAFGIVTRNRIYLNEIDIPVANLPKDLEGLRIAQISDIHLSPFLSEREFARAIDMANESKPHLVLVTGDLISRPGDPLDACLRQLARLRADAGVLGCMGNHEEYCSNKDYITEQGRRIGIDFLRGRSRMLRFGTANINFAGVDYQKFREPYLVGAEGLVVPGTLNVMLSHNPDVFEVAASQGYDVTIAGHTHGGQVNFEILRQDLNVARYFTPYVRGLYRRDKAVIYVSTGIGTIGVPVRIGAPAEVAVLRLCAS
jgi:predicted MPP superfamily phosphohydrolase